MNEIERALINRLAAHMVGSAKILREDPIWHPIHQYPEVQFANTFVTVCFMGIRFISGVRIRASEQGGQGLK